MRQRRQRSAMVRTRGALAIDALWSGGARTVRRAQRLRPRVLARARRVSHRSTQPMGPAETRGGIAGASMWCLCSCLSEKLHRGTRPACNTSRVGAVAQAPHAHTERDGGAHAARPESRRTASRSHPDARYRFSQLAVWQVHLWR